MSREEPYVRRPEPVLFEIEGKRQRAHETWYRGPHCHFNPKIENMYGATAVLDHVVRGWAPAAPCITPKTRITAFGSCFAGHILKWLRDRGYAVQGNGRSSAYVIHHGEGLLSAPVIRQQLEWAFEGRKFEAELWHDFDGRAYGYDEKVRRNTRRILLDSEVVIITFGLSEIWYDEPTGGVFWRAVPRARFDPSRHRFRVASVAENIENLEVIRQLLATHCPRAKVIFTLSPIPLVATFRPTSIMTANAASKAILRAAVDEVCREHRDGVLHYWPSYEIVMDVFPERWLPDRRHVKPRILDYVMALFEYCWCVGEEPRQPPLREWVRACIAGGLLPAKLQRPVHRENVAAITALLPELKDGQREVVQAFVDLLSETSASSDSEPQV